MSTNGSSGWKGVRSARRVHTLEDISIHYEGHTEEISARPPDISLGGMFINTTRYFPEGAILNLRFRLGLSGAQIEARGEVRYCLEGVGIGVEFIGLSSEAKQSIEEEVRLAGSQSGRKKTMAPHKMAAVMPGLRRFRKSVVRRKKKRRPQNADH